MSEPEPVALDMADHLDVYPLDIETLRGHHEGTKVINVRMTRALYYKLHSARIIEGRTISEICTQAVGNHLVERINQLLRDAETEDARRAVFRIIR